jgi:hypothetical protein
MTFYGVHIALHSVRKHNQEAPYNNKHGFFTMHHVSLLDIKMHDGF